MNRREFLATAFVAGTAPSATAVGQHKAAARIVGMSCSPCAGKTTAAALNICLEAAKAVDVGVTTELIELAGRNAKVRDRHLAGPPGCDPASSLDHGDDLC